MYSQVMTQVHDFCVRQISMMMVDSHVQAYRYITVQHWKSNTRVLLCFSVYVWVGKLLCFYGYTYGKHWPLPQVQCKLLWIKVRSKIQTSCCYWSKKYNSVHPTILIQWDDCCEIQGGLLLHSLYFLLYNKWRNRIHRKY